MPTPDGGTRKSRIPGALSWLQQQCLVSNCIANLLKLEPLFVSCVHRRLKQIQTPENTDLRQQSNKHSNKRTPQSTFLKKLKSAKSHTDVNTHFLSLGKETKRLILYFPYSCSSSSAFHLPWYMVRLVAMAKSAVHPTASLFKLLLSTSRLKGQDCWQHLLTSWLLWSWTPG